MMQIHASCVAVEGRAVLLRGPSGGGKSDLALRLIDGGARLVADDRVDLVREQGRLWAACPAPLAGLIELRGIGILRLAAERQWGAARAPVALVVDLVAEKDVERLPERRQTAYLDIDVPLLALAPFHCSAAAKIRLALSAPAQEMIPRSDPGLDAAQPPIPDVI